MTYRENFVACIKVNGKILREYQDVVYLPFGSEYSILLKNLNSKRAIVDIKIDGKHVGGTIVVDANSDVELERFIDHDFEKGYKFRFIEKTKEIEEHRGNKAEDGIIQITYRFEIPPTIHLDSIPIITTREFEPQKWEITCDSVSTNSDDANRCSFMDMSVRSSKGSRELYSSEIRSSTTPINQDGITVKGNDSDQKFQMVNVGVLERESYVICFKLLGKTETEEPVKIPVAVTTKITCPTCGKKSTSANKFCPNCSTRLIS